MGLFDTIKVATDFASELIEHKDELITTGNKVIKTVSSLMPNKEKGKSKDKSSKSTTTSDNESVAENKQ